MLSYSKMLIILISISLITKILAIFIFQINSINDHSDIAVYVDTSKDLVELGYAQQHANYCYAFSHMYWFAVFLTPITAVFGVSQIAYSMYLSVILTLVAVLLFDLITFISNKNNAFYIILLYLILPSQILLPQYVTHETASLLFLSLYMWLYFKMYKKAKTRIKKIVIVALSLISVFISSALNSLGLIAIIATFIIFLVEYIRSKDKTTIFIAIVKSVGLILVFTLGTALLGEIQLQNSQLDSNRIPNNKVLWTLYVGSNYESKGEWFLDDKWDDYPQSYDSEAIDNYHKDLILAHYKELITPPTKILDHIKNKFVTIWGDFSYPIGYSNETISNESVRQIYNRLLFKPFTLLNYVLLLLAAVFGLYKLLKNRMKNNSLFLVFCELYLLGSTALLLITECRNKYIISIIPVFIIVSLMNTKESFDSDKHLVGTSEH